MNSQNTILGSQNLAYCADGPRNLSQRKSVLFRLASWNAVAICLLVFVSTCFAQVVADGKLDTQSNWSLFVVRKGTGNICVETQAGANTNSGAGAVCTMTVDQIGFGGKGLNNAPKPGHQMYADSAVGPLGTTSSGVASFDYTNGFVTDDAVYAASTSITPDPPRESPATARAGATDPIYFDAPPGGLTLTLDAILSGAKLTIPGAVGGMGASASLDGVELFDFHMFADGSPKAEFSYTSILGPAFDAAMLQTLNSELIFDPQTDTYSFAGSIDLFPNVPIFAAEGDHSLEEGYANFVEANAPEPSSLLLLGSGILGLSGFVRKRLLT
jgi:PEP-CTERM motif